MATVKAFIRVAARKSPEVNIRFRLSVRRGVQLFHTSELKINPALWDNDSQGIRAKVLCSTHKKNEITIGVANRKSLILEIYDSAPDKDGLTSEWLDQEIDKRLHPEKPKSEDFFEVLDEFIVRKKFSELRRRDFRVIERTLQRYNRYRLWKSAPPLTFDNFSSETLYDIDQFLRNEHQIYREHSEWFADMLYKRKPVERGQNTINHFFGRLRSFFTWSIDTGKTTADPFKKFSIEECVYGTPYYITIEERNRLYRTNLARHPALAVQRDIFVFQCLIGCRVGDLYRMTKRNIIGGAIEYVAGKTKDGRPITVRVPLNSVAKEILSRYPDGDRLFPFISEQKYNVAIKRMFLAARLRRSVTVINPTTREPEIRPLNEIASSHLARRTFVGNLYKKVKDPNLVGALSGHKEGSRSFARYRDIDEEMKIDLVNLLEK